jgi:hypothetical protein
MPDSARSHRLDAWNNGFDTRDGACADVGALSGGISRSPPYWLLHGVVLNSAGIGMTSGSSAVLKPEDRSVRPLTVLYPAYPKFGHKTFR